MANVKGEYSDVSPVLFLNAKGEPMRFYIRPGPTKMQLQPLISGGGGVLCRTQEPKAMLLADPGDLRAGLEDAGHFYISTQYIRDCVSQNHQLDMESYRFSNHKPVQTRTTTRRQRGNGRMGYSPKDDAAILDFIGKQHHQTKGNRVWQQMERQGVTGHSWQSMKDRFLKHLQFKLSEKHSSSDEVGTPKKTQKKAPIAYSSDSDALQIPAEDLSQPESSSKDRPNPDLSTEECSSAQTPESEKQPTLVNTDKGQSDVAGDDLVQEEHPQSNQENEQPGPSPKKARSDKDAADETDTTNGQNNQKMSDSETRQKGRKKATKRKLGILERAAREFEDSQVLDNESQENRPPSRTPSDNSSDADETQIMAAREIAVREQEANTDSIEAEHRLPDTRNDRGAQGATDEVPGPSSAALPITSNAHMFLFDSESQEDPSQPSQTETPSQNLDEKQLILNLIEDSKCDLKEVIKAVLKASGDVILARSYLLNGYHPEEHGPLWSREDDEILLSNDFSGQKQLLDKYGGEKVARRRDFLKSE